MSEQFRYRAFGLVMESEIAIIQLPVGDENAPADVVICRHDLSKYAIKEDQYRIRQNELLFSITKVGIFHITNGDRIEVDPIEGCSDALLGVYLMGSGMGAILHQRGYMPLHGSCVTDDTNAVLIVGDSGAGKSTLAAEFLSHGWKLLTDDVAPVSNAETTPSVQASYPSQKLWQDSMEQYEKSEKDVHSLYTSETREKFGVNVSEYFYDGCCPLSIIVRLIPTDEPCHIEPIEGMTKLDQLMRNTYRSYMIAPENRERHFRRCAALAGKVPMMLVTRQKGVQCADTLYEMIVNELGEMKNE